MSDNMEVILAAWTSASDYWVGGPWFAPLHLEVSGPLPVVLPLQGAIFEALGTTRLNAAARAGIGTLSRS
jgi:hypothetical protein